MAQCVQAGTVSFPAQELVIFGQSAHEAVAAEVARRGLHRIFVTSTRSLTRNEDGPLQRIVEALGPRYVGRFTAIGSHSPDYDVVTGAIAARRAGTELILVADQ
ncbi:hypothetical protein [Bradyrhizobium sp. 192]|uniref:hypothetical protein n=1 Tax=Bradyrhizobium sp. 192 TaxID=2782660 RepID=UPI002000042E|nr:hypothetical protein [Bradyrhizobium sp. 192]UPJ59863.1 hypothetical protein IVB24_09070 [Bradyrhizobium sp. 192]